MMELPALGPVWLTLKLALVTTLVLLILGTPIAWWLAFTRSRAKPFVEALTGLPLVLPATVLGFYLLIFLSPTSPLGSPPPRTDLLKLFSGSQDGPGAGLMLPPTLAAPDTLRRDA